jgi:cytoskeletal protein CcmA (bactofilin family)
VVRLDLALDAPSARSNFMRITFKLFTLMLLLALLFLPASAVYARGPSSGLLDGRVVFGDNFTLASGDTLTGDLVVFGGNVEIGEDATIQGDMVVIGGSVTMDGTVNGSTVIVGGSTMIGESGVVRGDLVTVGGSLTREPGSEVHGEVVTNIPMPDIQVPAVPNVPNVPNVPSPPSPPNPPDVWFNFNPLGTFFRMFGTAIAVSLLAMLASLFLQPQIERVSQAVVGQPVIAGSIGLLTGVMTPFVLVILAITIILIPVVVIAAAALALAWLFGMIAIGTEVGERFTRAVNQTWAPPLTAGLGTFLMMLVVGGIGMIPCVGWLATSLVALLGVGGVVLTLFGTQSYPRVVPPMTPPGSNPVG